MLKTLTALALAVLALAGDPNQLLARRGAHHEVSSPPCGWSKGSLPDPAETQRCLAERYKPPKAKAPAANPPAQPSANAEIAPTGAR